MNLVILVGSYLRSRLLSTVMNIVLLALGIAVIVFILLVGRQMDEKVSSNSRGIDLVVGAKGSPLQIILCNIYHIDFPTGNINLREAVRVANNRLVKKAIPMALGDSYGGFRIVGTDTSYAMLYRALLADGKWWSEDLDVVLGNAVVEKLNLKVGDSFRSAHGLTTQGSEHDEHLYRVVGTLAPSTTVLDNLILTNVASVWRVHDVHGSSTASSMLSPLATSPADIDSTREITSMLIKFRNPLAAIQLPRLINGNTNMQAASPAFEMSRLYSILGVGIDALTGLAVVLIGISALSTFLALYNALKDRRYDMAIMRAMGAGRSKLFMAMVMEGSTLTISGTVLGIGIGHVLVLLIASLDSELTAGMDGLTFYWEEIYLVAGSVVMGVLCSVFPAIQAMRTNIHQVLAGAS